MKKAFGTIISVFLLSLALGLAFNVQLVQSAGDWWPMFHHDLAHIGYSSSTAPITNQTLWSYSTGASVSSSPAVVSGVVYVGSYDNKVYALNAANGALLWSFPTGAAVESSPAVDNGVVYIGSDSNKTYALNATSGALIWNYTTGGHVSSSPIVVGGVVYVGSNDKKVYALNNTNGESVWNFTTGAEVASSPAVANGKLYVGSSDSKVFCLDAATGAAVWNYTTYNSVTSSPAVADGRVYVGSWDASVYCLNASTGVRIWQFGDVGILSSPAVADGLVFIGQGGSYPRTKILALDAVAGNSIWNFTTGGSVVSSPAVADGKIYVGSQDDKIYALNDSNGALIWSYLTQNWVNSAPAIAEGKLYVGSYDNKVYAFSSLLTPNFTLGADSASVVLSQSVNLTGILSLPKNGSVTLDWAINSSGFIYQTTENLTNGVFSRIFGFGQTGTWQFRVNWLGDASSNPATSNIVTVTVIPNAIPEFPTMIISLLLLGFAPLGTILGKKTFGQAKNKVIRFRKMVQK